MVVQTISKRKSLRLAITLLGLALLPLLTSCEAISELQNDLQKEKSNDPDRKFDFVERNNSEKYKEPDPSKPEEVEINTTGKLSEKLDKQAKALSEEPYKDLTEKSFAEKQNEKNKEPGARKSRYYEDFILFDADEEIEVSINFTSAPILDVLQAFADILEFNYVADSGLRSVSTVNINSTMTRRELWEVFDRMLQMSHLAAYRDENSQLLRIMSAGYNARQPEMRIANDGEGNSEVVIYSLKNITAGEANNILHHFTFPGGGILQNWRPNMLIMWDNSENIPKLLSILELIDQPGRRNWPRVVLPCVNVQPSKVAADLSQILPVLGFTLATPNTRGETPGSIYLTSIDRLQLLVASAATDEALALLRQWVATLDSTESDEEERVYVYKVANGKAGQLAQALSVVFTTQGSSLVVDSSSGNSRTQNLSTLTTKVANNGSSGSAQFTRAGTNNDLNTTTTVRSNIFTTPVRIFSDGIYNRLIIRTTPRVYRVMKALLDRLDSVPAQVLLQVLIVEVSLDDGDEFGVEFNFKGSGGGTLNTFGTQYSQLNPGKGTDTGANFYIANPNNPEEKFAYIRALATRNKVKIISSPQLLVTSNTEATIQIGDSVPLVTGSVSSSESIAGQVTNSYQYRETGIIMTMTPQVTSSDLISLEIKQEISEAVTNTISTAKDTPVIQKREIETAMTIANGKTVVMGGMIQEKVADDLDSIPIISDIPFLGRLFGNTKRSKGRTEMLVLVTGYIVDEKGKVEDMIKRYNEAVKALSVFEGEIADAHKADMEREERIRKEKAAEKAKRDAEKAAEEAKRDAEKAAEKAAEEAAAKAVEKAAEKSAEAPAAANDVKVESAKSADSAK